MTEEERQTIDKLQETIISEAYWRNAITDFELALRFAEDRARAVTLIEKLIKERDEYKSALDELEES